MFSVLVIRLRSLRLLRVSGIVMRLRMFLLLITFLKASHSFRNRLLVICKNAYLFADRKSGSAGMPRPISYAVFCLKKKRPRRRVHIRKAHATLRQRSQTQDPIGHDHARASDAGP